MNPVPFDHKVSLFCSLEDDGETARYRLEIAAIEGSPPGGSLPPKSVEQDSSEPAEASPSEPAKEIEWMASLLKARRLASQQNKPIFIKWTAKWCKPCQEMERTVFQDQEVLSLLEGFVCLKMDFDEQPTQARVKRLKSLPTFIIENSRGKESDRKGVLSAEEMTSWLGRFLAKSEIN